ncbi:MAG: NUDIX domain-containing protein [Candidatus Eisenbacteria bacterium]|uniref:NUDIX domain-containing protein n=1 Tax=Eiseniibacteriota bacterium TaxID=2212470 RepID=A0A849SGS6_UNCEI|nr:NUDIX domain-containing protein [Candidatus Eisenbacteria bacterium]
MSARGVDAARTRRTAAGTRTRRTRAAVERGPVFACRQCGGPVARTSGEKPRKIHCPRCRYLLYDYPRAAAGMLVVRGDEVLVLRRAHPPRVGRLDIPGGFVDAGEELEAAARRELLEETGLAVGRCEWLGFWWDRYWLDGFGAFPTMNFYWLARWRRGTPRTADDAASAEWMPLARVLRARRDHAWGHMDAVYRTVRKRLARHA